MTQASTVFEEIASGPESERDTIKDVDPRRPVSDEFIDSLRQAGAPESLLAALRGDRSRRKH